MPCPRLPLLAPRLSQHAIRHREVNLTQDSSCLSANSIILGDCPIDLAFTSDYSIDFTNGADGNWHDLASATTFNNLGAEFSLTTMGQSYTYVTNKYFLFGRVDVKMRTAPGQGIVSAFVLQSDDLDEIDWEFLGGWPTQGQVNTFTQGRNPVRLYYFRIHDYGRYSSLTLAFLVKLCSRHF